MDAVHIVRLMKPKFEGSTTLQQAVSNASDGLGAGVEHYLILAGSPPLKT